MATPATSFGRTGRCRTGQRKLNQARAEFRQRDTKGSDLLVAALENEGVACIFATPGEETIFQLFCLAVFIHVPSRDRRTHTQFSFRTNTFFCGRFWWHIRFRSGRILKRNSRCKYDSPHLGRSTSPNTRHLAYPLSLGSPRAGKRWSRRVADLANVDDAVMVMGPSWQVGRLIVIAADAVARPAAPHLPDLRVRSTLVIVENSIRLVSAVESGEAIG